MPGAMISRTAGDGGPSPASFNSGSFIRAREFACWFFLILRHDNLRHSLARERLHQTRRPSRNSSSCRHPEVYSSASKPPMRKPQSCRLQPICLPLCPPTDLNPASGSKQSRMTPQVDLDIQNGPNKRGFRSGCYMPIYTFGGSVLRGEPAQVTAQRVSLRKRGLSFRA